MSAVVEQIMGMPIVVDVRDENADNEDLVRMFDWLRWVDATFSTYREDSEISRIDRGELEPADAHPEVRSVPARGDHVLDPHTGRPPADVLSVTVVGTELGTADAYATAAFAMGARGPQWTAELSTYEAMTILADETVLTTGGFPDA